MQLIPPLLVLICFDPFLSLFQLKFSIKTKICHYFRFASFYSTDWKFFNSSRSRCLPRLFRRKCRKFYGKKTVIWNDLSYFNCYFKNGIELLFDMTPNCYFKKFLHWYLKWHWIVISNVILIFIVIWNSIKLLFQMS
jgi:hypothetical protein